MTPILYYGPMARDKAITRASLIGRPVSDPVGDKGLKVDDSRRIVVLANSSGVGDKPPSIVVGPLDKATPEAGDALLKTLEDLAEGPLRMVLWAEHLKGVIGTIRSRTLLEWCPPDKGWIDPLSWANKDSKELMLAVRDRDEIGILEILSRKDNKKHHLGILESFCRHLSKEVVSGKPEYLNMWISIRKVLDGKGSYLSSCKAILGGLP